MLSSFIWDFSELSGAAWFSAVTDRIIYELFIAPANMLLDAIRGHVQFGGAMSLLSIVGTILLICILAKAFSAIGRCIVLFFVFVKHKREDRLKKFERLRNKYALKYAEENQEFDKMYKSYVGDKAE